MRKIIVSGNQTYSILHHAREIVYKMLVRKRDKLKAKTFAFGCG